MSDNQIALVTGANKGIGQQIAKDLASKGFTVLVGTRSLANGEAVTEGMEGNAKPIQLDVTDQASIAAAVEHIRSAYGRLDVLVNNAGVSRADKPSGGVPADMEGMMKANSIVTASLDDVRQVWDTNVFGLIAVTQAMLPLLRQGSNPRIVTVGSTGGSLAWNSNPENEHRIMYGNYSTSKSAAHAVTLAFAFALEKEGIKVNIACPGHTATSLNNFMGTRSVEQGAHQPVTMALIGPDGPTGTFTDEDGSVPW